MIQHQAVILGVLAESKIETQHKGDDQCMTMNLSITAARTTTAR